MMNYLEELPIHRVKEIKYQMTLSIYPVSLCGSDLQKGNPLKVYAEGEELCRLKMQAEELVLSAMSDKRLDGECFI